MRKLTSKEICRTLSTSFLLFIILSFNFVKAFHSHNGESFLLSSQISKLLPNQLFSIPIEDSKDKEESQHHCPICDFTLSTFTTEDNVSIPYIESYVLIEQPLYTYEIVAVSIIGPSLRAPPESILA